MYLLFLASGVRAKILRSSSCTLAYVATVERTLIPIGVASMSFTWSMPSALTDFTCAGSFSPRICAESAGIRLSRMSVVLPEPETPVTTVRRPFGISTSSGFTVWMRSVERWIAPFWKSLLSGAFCREMPCFPAKNGPICEFSFILMSSVVPSAMTWPPFAPASGPISMSQSASLKICVS